MEPAAMEQLIKNIDERLARVEQKLPTLATKDDLKAFVTKEDAKAFVTKEDAKGFATKEDMRLEGERTRRHFDMVAEAMGVDLKVVAEGHGTLESRIADIQRRYSGIEHWRERLDMRVQALETAASRRRK